MFRAQEGERGENGVEGHIWGDYVMIQRIKEVQRFRKNEEYHYNKYMNKPNCINSNNNILCDLQYVELKYILKTN